MEESPSGGALPRRTFWELDGYQWAVLFAAWVGWGFDAFDALLFNFVAPNCVPTLLGLTIGSPEAGAETLRWTGWLTALLLVGWAVGGILFGRLADRIGRSRTLVATMLLYALGTALCAAAPNLWVLAFCRLVASLGIGGEWAAGAAMVAEVVPERRRLEAGALLYTSAPLGIFLASLVNFRVAGDWLRGQPELSWRFVFLAGLLPAVAALAFRAFVREPERWRRAAGEVAPARLGELFSGETARLTRSGLAMALTALAMWWSANAFLPATVSGLAAREAELRGLARPEMLALAESWKASAAARFNWGGLLGTLLTVPIARRFGRRAMFGLYFALSAAALFAAFRPGLSPEARMPYYFWLGVTVFGVFGSFTYYLPELFPTRLRATGAGFCYNVGRVLAAAGPFLVGSIAARGLDATLAALFAVGFVPLAGMAFLPWVVETRGRGLVD